MKSRQNAMISVSLRTALFAALALTSHAQTVSVDGVRDEVEGYTLVETQATQSSWNGPHQPLANLYSKQEGGSLVLHMAASADGGNAIILFLDTKPGGVNFINNNQITSGGEHYTINNLGSSPTAGLTFESGFNPDYAIRIFDFGSDMYVNIYNLSTGTRVYAGNSVSNISTGIIQDMKTVWGNYTTSADYATANKGVEMKLSLALMGVPFGPQTVKTMAVLVNEYSNYASNQVLGSRTSTSDPIGGGINAINFETETGTQTISLTVDNTDTDGDGQINQVDTDDDNDGLLDTVESDDGIYDSPTDTGSDPLLVDTDGDGVNDGLEVAGGQFGLGVGDVSNPNLPNYTTMAVPGNFTTPPWKENGSAGNSMTRKGTSLTDQYIWTLDYRFTVLGGIQYKFAANGSYTNSWGGPGGSDIVSNIRATGFHTFTFNTATATGTLTRTVFSDVNAFLAAYNVDAIGTSDSDTLANADEFNGNTDPRIYETAPIAVTGTAGSNFGNFKFFNTIPGAPNLGYETGNDRNFVLGPAGVTQTVPNPVEYFGGDFNLPTTYADWSGATGHNLAPEDARGDDPDDDGFTNLQEFLFGTPPNSSTGAQVTATTGIGTMVLTWLQRTGVAGYSLLENTDLGAWSPSAIVPAAVGDQSSVPAGYTRMQATVPSSNPKTFLRVKGVEF